ncbi:MAG TPA: hypothetical protein DFR83_28655 [Deltaproteobacteria bacterium]|nr:hypothetical protein [Deltaproteobacteria bacterium]
MVDELGGLEAAIAYAASTAEIDAYAIERFPERRTFMDQLLEELTNSAPDADARLAETIRSASLPGTMDGWAGLVRLRRILADGGAAMLLPGDFSVLDPNQVHHIHDEH